MCQFELFVKPVKIILISDQGFRIFNLTPRDGKELILKQTNKSGLWLYIDGIQTNPERINVE